MAEDELAYKIRNFLIENDPFKKECCIVYLMVEIRKLLDRIRESGNNNPYPWLRFYCDWTLHTSKNKITPEMEEIMKKVDEFIPKEKTRYPAIASTNQPDIRFVYMDQLREEMKNFLTDFDLPKNIVTEEEKWISFVSLLVQVLVNQPIINPTENIESFHFEPSNFGSVIWGIQFKDERGYWRSANVF